LKDAPVVASETCAFDLIGAKFIREVEPGEILLINGDGIQSFKPFPPAQPHQCIFEFIYFARPDSFIFNRNVYEVRKSFGVQLAKESPATVDMVIPIPDSGIPATIGYAQESRSRWNSVDPQPLCGEDIYRTRRADPSLRCQDQIKPCKRPDGG
jgi:amidophosphoribosyltransferase